jgi:hypothetical protein
MGKSSVDQHGASRMSCTVSASPTVPMTVIDDFRGVLRTIVERGCEAQAAERLVNLAFELGLQELASSCTPLKTDSYMLSHAKSPL